MASKSKHVPGTKSHSELMPWFIAIILSCVLRTSSSETIAQNDFRFVSYHDLSATASRFEDQNVTTFSRLLFDVSRNSLVVGARDRIYRLSLNNLELMYKVDWEVPSKIIDTCLAKGQSDNDCRNYITVLHEYNNKLLSCGTFAYSPNCSWRNIDDLNLLKSEKGVGKSPFNPRANITTLMTDDGKMFIGSATDFSGADSAILRNDLSVSDAKILRTKQYNSEWLNSPQFVGSFENGDFIYLVFREVAVEVGSYGKAVYSRIARVCKNDNGGIHYYKDNWTSFLKARLNCSLPGEYPFYFNEVQGISYSADDGELYATFSTPENSIHGAAICVFNIASIEKAFNGPVKYQEIPGGAWQQKYLQPRDNFDCKANQKSNSLELSKYQLMDGSVQAIHPNPLYVTKLERFRKIAVDKVATKLHESVRIIFVTTDDGLIKKISVLPRTKQSCLIEAMEPESSRDVVIKTMEFVKATDSLYVGTEHSLIKIPSQRCGRHQSKESCLNSMDPMCGWNDLQLKCSPPPNNDPLASHWYQNATVCPILSSPVDGAFSAWTQWFKCAKSGGDDLITGNEQSDSIETCLCRERSCANPAPKNGGRDCTGMSIMVTNCTVNGGWTDWSAWGPCSQSCGVAIKTRKRSCGNPAPKFGGRVCIGSDRQEIYCNNLPPCPQPTLNVQIDGQWGPFGDWSECSAACGGGFRFRQRKCDDPAPQNGGLECIGCNIEYENCNKQPCVEVKKLSPWTQWLTVNGSNDIGYVEKRFRYSCRATIADPANLKISLSKEETRNCSVEGCHRMAEAPMKASWGCWTDFSACSVTCGLGRRVRYRKCMSSNGDTVSDKECDGPSSQDEICEMPSCDSMLGWSEWSEWSTCNSDNERTRFRQCVVRIPGPKECLGNEREVRICNPGLESETIVATASLGIHWIISIMMAFGLFCTVLAIFLTKYLVEKRINRLRTIQGSPHYGAYPNQYSSLPTKDYVENNKPKRQHSFNGGTAGNSKIPNGTLTKSNNMMNHNTPKIMKYKNDTDMSTLKRNSALNNMRLKQIEDDKDKY